MSNVDKQYQLQVIIASGENEYSKAILGFAFALGAASGGTSVVLFLTMDGACWTDTEKGNETMVNGFESINTYWDLLLEMGADFEGCTSCFENYCNQKINKCSPRKGMILSGLSTAAFRSSNTQTIVF